MKYPRILPSCAFVWAGLLSLAIGTVAQARVGEGQSTIERRLFASGGIQYRDDEIVAKRQKGMPYLQYLDYLPKSVDLCLYFKTDDGSRPKSSEMEANRLPAGWDVHVLYVRGKSVLEVYKRSKQMSDYEFNILLKLQAGGSFWKKVAKGDLAEDAPASAFGFEMMTEDGKVLAKKLGADGLMVFNAELDMRLAQSLAADLQELAPQSVSGF